MIYLPSKIKYKYVFMICVVLGQLMFMSYMHNSNIFKGVNQIATFDSKKIPQIYKNLIQKISPSRFVQYDLSKRCSTYFEELSHIDEHWEISSLEGSDYSLDVLSSQEYYERKYEELKRKFIDDGKDVGDINTKDIMNDLNSKLIKNRLVEDKIATSVSHLRVYGTCYINNDDPNTRFQQCSDIETKLFPWLTFESPVFERWDGTIVNDYPRISKFYRYAGEGDLDFEPSHDACLLSSLRQKFNGRGIVLSIDDHLIDELIKFIKTLRYLGNELPIQFVHKGDLSLENRERLIQVSRSNFVIKNSITINEFKQETWFVDVSRCIQDTHHHKFYTYRNKWLLVLFNSFEEMILMDTDVVTFIKPEEYFKFEGYKNTKAFFFKDRESGQQNKQASKELLLKLLPRDLENIFFQIPKLTDFTLKNKFFDDNAFHYMESGIVVIDRKERLLGLLISTQLQFWDPILSHTHGDKELFWLGQSFAGNENYYFNPNAAGAVGKLVRNLYSHSEMIVGAQPAHVGPDNQTLLWINSGLETCKKHSWKNDFENHLKIANGFNSELELREYYVSPLDIEGVIIPPDLSHVYPNDQGEPEKGWKQLEHDGCAGYLWGGYSKVGGDKIQDLDSFGTKVEFEEESKQYFQEMGKVWVNEQFYYVDGQYPSTQKLSKYWKILEMYGSIKEYEKVLNKDKKEGQPKEKWDDSELFKFLSSSETQNS